MSRSQRLLEILQLLRQYRYPVPGKALADKLHISLRTLYRDIATLQTQGADIQGEPGMGYILKPGFMLPPLMFTEEEIEALVLGARWVARRADDKLKFAAIQGLAKISAILPNELRYQLETSGLVVGPPTEVLAVKEGYEALIRYSIRKEFKLMLKYTDEKNETSERTILPLALGFFDDSRVIVAWCELRKGFRHFRTDRISSLVLVEQHFDQKRTALLKQWRKLHNIPEQ